MGVAECLSRLGVMMQKLSIHKAVPKLTIKGCGLGAYKRGLEEGYQIFFPDPSSIRKGMFQHNSLSSSFFLSLSKRSTNSGGPSYCACKMPNCRTQIAFLAGLVSGNSGAQCHVRCVAQVDVFLTHQYIAGPNIVGGSSSWPEPCDLCGSGHFNKARLQIKSLEGGEDKK